MINFYLENIFLITVIALGLATVVPIFGILIFKQRGSSLNTRPDIKDILLNFSTVLFIVGLIIPLVFMLIVKIKPNFFEEVSPYAGYFIAPLLLWLIFLNIMRFKLIKKKQLIQVRIDDEQVNGIEEIVGLEKKTQEYLFQMVMLVIVIVCLVVLSNLRSF